MINTQFVYEMCCDNVCTAFNKDYFLKTTLSVPLYEKAVAMPTKAWINANNEITMGGGIDDSRGNFIEGTNIQTNTEGGYPYEDPECCDEEVVYIGLMHSCYGHMITDCLSKLWYIQTKEYRNNPKTLLYLSIGSLKKWHYEILELAGIDVSKIKTINRVTRFKSITIPDNSQIREPSGEHLWTQEFRMTIDLMIQNALSKETTRSDKKIYLTRTKWNRTYDDYGENTIEPLFAEAGYKIYSPECYSVAQQIAIMQGADEMVSTDCSSAHNAIFMRPKSRMVLLRKGLYVNYYSVMISQLCELQTVIVDCSMSIINRNGKFAYAGPFFIYPNTKLCEYLGLKRKEFPYRQFRNYIKGIWRRRLSEYLIMDSVYAEELMKEIGYSSDRLNEILSRILPNPIKNLVIRRLYKMIMNYKMIGLL